MSISPSAARMRRHRQRKREGMRSLQIELRETDVDALIESGFLDERSRDDANAIIRALYKLFDDILIE
jgi:SOS response regulatory protein OraA/RecX